MYNAKYPKMYTKLNFVSRCYVARSRIGWNAHAFVLFGHCTVFMKPASAGVHLLTDKNELKYV